MAILLLNISHAQAATEDFSDAPASYGDAPTIISANIYLGTTQPDSEIAGQPGHLAKNDGVEEDGAPADFTGASYFARFPILLETASSYTVPITVNNVSGSDATLESWIDFDHSGTFDNDELTTVSVPNGTSGAVNTTWSSLPGIENGTTYIRLRLTNAAGEGEVEDHIIGIAFPIPPESPSVTVIPDISPLECQSTVFEDDFNDIPEWTSIAPNRSGSTSVRNWTLTGGGEDTYAVVNNISTYGSVIYLGNGMVRRIDTPSNLGSGFSFDANNRLTTTINAIELRSDPDDLNPGTTEYEADWGPDPLVLSRTFPSEIGKTYRLYFTSIPEASSSQAYLEGIMRVDTPAGSAHFKIPAIPQNGNEADYAIDYAIEFTATSTTSTISFVNYGHFGQDINNDCNPQEQRSWCTIGGYSSVSFTGSGEAKLDNVKLVESACETGTLTLLKEVADGSAVDTEWTLAATDGPTTGISGAEGTSSVTNASVFVGTYNLVESNGPSGYVQTGLACTGAADTDPSDGITIAKDENVVCTFTNSVYVPPVLSCPAGSSLVSQTGHADSVVRFSSLNNPERATGALAASGSNVWSGASTHIWGNGGSIDVDLGAVVPQSGTITASVGRGGSDGVLEIYGSADDVTYTLMGTYGDSGSITPTVSASNIEHITLTVPAGGAQYIRFTRNANNDMFVDGVEYSQICGVAVEPTVTPFPEGPGIGSSVCSADAGNNPYADIFVRWEHNINNGTSPAATIDNTAVIQSATDETYVGLNAQINGWDLNIDRSSIPANYDANKYISYSFTTKDFSGQVAELYGFAAASFESTESWHNQDTGAYKVAILIDDDATFSSPDVLINEVAFDDGVVADADTFAGPDDHGTTLYTIAHYNADNIVTLASNTTYYLRVYPYGDTKSGMDSGQPYSEIVLWDDFMLKAVNCSEPAAANALSGIVFEDVNYGGGAGRDQATSSGVGVNGATVELYDNAGALLESTTTANDGSNDGTYSFTNVSTGDYYIRVVSDTVSSTRTGSDGSELAVQTFRTDGATAVTNEVGGRYPAQADASIHVAGATLNDPANGDFTFSGGAMSGPAQSVTPVTMASANVTGIDFGFNFDTIVNTNDSGQGSLRQFILNSNLLDNTGLDQVDNPADGALDPAAGIETSIFEIPAAGLQTITPTTALPAVTDAFTALDATTQTGANCSAGSRTLMVQLDGTSAGVNEQGIRIDASNASIRGFSIGQFSEQGIYGSANADNLVIACNNVGLAADGATTQANGLHGIWIEDADNITIGGATETERNVISGNTRHGVNLDGVNTATVRYNYIGTDVSGTIARTNNGEGAQYGGLAATAGANNINILDNLISGNDKVFGAAPVNTTDGIYLNGADTISITRNLIGTSANGLSALGNSGAGIYSFNTKNITIGGTTSAERNIISGNGEDGINTRFGTDNIAVLGNYIGTDINGTGELGNVDNGVFFQDTSNASVGDGSAGGRNIIAGNDISGVRVTKTPDTTVKGNYIGTDVSGAVGLGNSLHGIYVQNSAGVIIGGSAAGDRNVIADNGVIGVFMVNAASNTRVENNLVGLLSDGNTIAANGQSGVETSETDGVVIHGNVVSGNGTRGVHLVDSPNTTISDNLIGLNEAGTVDKGNVTYGIDVDTAAPNLTVSGNTISGNGDVAIRVLGGNATNNNIINNKIGVALDGTSAMGNDKGGVLVQGAAGVTIGGSGANDANIIANNTGDGVTILSAGANNNTVSRNVIYANTGLGIDLDQNDVTINDANDSDSGLGNDGLNFPQFSSLSLAGTSLTIEGCAPANATVELFEADVSATSTSGAAAGDNQFGLSQDYGEGEAYLNSFTLPATGISCTLSTDTDNNNPTGMLAFSETLTVPASLVEGDSITATSTVVGTGTSEFSVSHRLLSLDYGDAPASYLEAAHKTVETPTVYLGNVAPDKERQMQHTANGGGDGIGDDLDGSDDEDAYDTLPTIWTTQSQYRLKVDCSDQGAYVSGWIDFNQNGEFDIGERNSDFPRTCTSTGEATLNWTGLSGLSAGTTYARLRIASDQTEVSTPDGEASDGEVEDYPVVMQNQGSQPGVCDGVISWLDTTGQGSDPVSNWSIDWRALGIRSDISFSSTKTGTTNRWAGPTISMTDPAFVSRFGSSAPVISFGEPATGTDDGQTQIDISFSEGLPANTYMVVRDIDANDEQITFSNNNLGSLPVPSYWESQSPRNGVNDPSLFGSWNSTLQQIVTLSDGPNNDQEAYVWPVTGLRTLRSTYTTAAGFANLGFVSCIPQDHADAPDTYATYKASSGPQHGVINGVYLGSTAPDTESDGQPSATAANDGADEDAVSALSVLTTSDRTYSTTVKASNDTSNPATLIAWIDFDGNGTFDADEAAIRTVAAGSNQANYTLNWSNIPVDIAEGSTYLRLRLTTDSLNNREPGGAKIDGEVEDHPISITTAGVTVSGRVFRDVNVNAANDSGEVGVTQLPVVLYDTINDTCVSTRTDGNGDYMFRDVTPGTYQVYEASRQKVPVPVDCGPAFARNPANYRSTTADVRDAFTVTTSDITDQDFGEVKPPVFEPDNAGQILPGNVLFYAHKFTTPTKGSVSFTSVSSGNTSSGWSSILYRDANCDGVLSGSEAAAPLENPLAASAASSVCLINKVYAPSNVAANDTSIQTITAAFDYENPYAGTQSLVVKDVTTAQQVQAPTLPATPEVVATPAVPAQPEQPATPNVPATVGTPATDTTPEVAPTPAVDDTPYIPATDPEPAQAPVAATPVVEELGPSRLELRKTVRNITKDSEETATVNTAEPGDTLEYRIYYSNTGTGPITDLVVNDTVPPYTTLLGISSCGTVLSGMSCTASPLGLDDSLKWTFTGTLTGGSGSSVSYQVKIDE